MTAEELSGRITTLIAMIQGVIGSDRANGRILHADALESGLAALEELREIRKCECPLYYPKSMTPL